MSQLRAETAVVNQLRARWLRTIDELGPAAAAEDAAQAFVVRSRCSLEEGRAEVARAWGILGIRPGHP
jgi:hypothetical protein